MTIRMRLKWHEWQQRLEQGKSKALCLVFLVAIFFMAGAALSDRSLSYPWYEDDFHLVRNFSLSELRQVFIGNWDNDGIETPGYRPLTVLFNGFRAHLFGESVVAHRLFQIALVAAYLAFVSEIAMNLGLSYWAAMFAGIFTICSKNNWWNLVWIADGVHAAAGLFLALATLLSILAVKRFALWKIALAELIPTANVIRSFWQNLWRSDIRLIAFLADVCRETTDSRADSSRRFVVY